MYKEFLAIGAGRHATERQWSCRQLEGHGRGPAKQPRRFTYRPDVGSGSSVAQEEIVAGIRRPPAAAFGGRVAPSRQYSMKIAAIRSNLPDRRRVILGSLDLEADAGSVRRESGLVRRARNGNQLMRIGS